MKKKEKGGKTPTTPSLQRCVRRGLQSALSSDVHIRIAPSKNQNNERYRVNDQRQGTHEYSLPYGCVA
ncbi:MAG TPA: hypothetical protein VEF35_04190 [Candidatus Bathyarchaeia archaeon]|nr:hypothetical protein [Candidatus Bathyarchaeia archaeon]